MIEFQLEFIYNVLSLVCLVAFASWNEMFLFKAPVLFFIQTSRVLACLLAFSIILTSEKLVFAMLMDYFHHSAYVKRIDSFNEFSSVIASVLEQIEDCGKKKWNRLGTILRSELDRRTCPERHGDPVRGISPRLTGIVPRSLFHGLKNSEYAEYIYESDLYRFFEDREEAHKNS